MATAPLPVAVEEGELRTDVTIPLLLARPLAPGRRPAVVLLHDVRGRTDAVAAACRRLAGWGAVAAAPDLLVRAGGAARGDADAGRRAVRRISDIEALNDIAALLEALAERPDCSGRLGVLGLGAGGRLALLLATSPSAPERVVDCYGEGMVKATALHDVLHPQIPIQRVQRLGAALLGIFAGADHDPSPAHVEELRGILAMLPGAVHRVVVVPGAAHGFLEEADPGGHPGELPGAASPARVAWEEIESWFRPLLDG